MEIEQVQELISKFFEYALYAVMLTYVLGGFLWGAWRAHERDVREKEMESHE